MIFSYKNVDTIHALYLAAIFSISFLMIIDPVSASLEVCGDDAQGFQVAISYMITIVFLFSLTFVPIMFLLEATSSKTKNYKDKGYKVIRAALLFFVGVYALEVIFSQLIGTDLSCLTP